MVTSLWNVLDFLAIFPPVVELVLLHGANVPFTLGRLDLRWFKILRRVPRSGCEGAHSSGSAEGTCTGPARCDEGSMRSEHLLTVDAPMA